MNGFEADRRRQQYVSGILDDQFLRKDLLATQSLLNPFIITAERAGVQALEIANIYLDADELETSFSEKGLPMPSAFGVFTTGHTPGENAVRLGELGQGIFHNNVAPETKGHHGEVYAVPIDDEHWMLGFFGRVHPNEYFGHSYGAILVARQLRVVKELIRRERADLGIDPPVFTDYLAGASEGHSLKVGEAGLILSDSEFTNVLHPGHGPVAILDEFLGSHFQSKFAPTSDNILSKFFLDAAGADGMKVKPVAVAGTLGTPEFQNPEEFDMWRQFVEKARSGQTGKWADELFVAGNLDLTAAYGMGITFEQAVLRQKFADEHPIKTIALVIVSDIVGETGSQSVSHTSNMGIAQEAAPLYQSALMTALYYYFQSPNYQSADRTDHSIRSKISRFVT